LFAMQDSALSGMRLAHWVPIENASFGLLKVGLLVLAWATVAGRSGETLALVFIGPVVLFVAVVNLALFRRALPAVGTEGTVERAAAPTFRDLRRFSTRDFLGSAATQLLQYGLPLVVAARLGAAANGNFYKAYVVVMSLDLLAMNLTTSMMVEGAHDSSRLGEFARRTALIVAIVVGLAALATAVGAPVILSAFGADDATLELVLRLLAIAVVARACTTLAVGIWRVQHRLRLASGAQVAVCAAVLVSAGLIADHGGLPAVAGAVAVAHLICAAVLVLLAMRTLRTLAPTANESSAVPA
jgi:O-antigen/teichoic acid export membrane protein